MLTFSLLFAVVLTFTALSAWRNQRDLTARLQRPRPAVTALNSLPGETDLAEAIRQALHLLDRDAARLLVRLDVAAADGLTLCTDPLRLRWMLIALFEAAIGRASCGRVLISAMRHGGRIQLCVTDDGPKVPDGVLAAALREVEQTIALQGGTLECSSQAGRGTTVTLRMLEPAQARPPAPVFRTEKLSAIQATQAVVTR